MVLSCSFLSSDSKKCLIKQSKDLKHQIQEQSIFGLTDDAIYYHHGKQIDIL